VGKKVNQLVFIEKELSEGASTEIEGGIMVRIRPKKPKRSINY